MRLPLFLCLAFLLLITRITRADTVLLGTLQSDPTHIARNRDAGITIATVELAWDRYQPAPDRFDDAYARETKAKIARFREAGQQVYLDLGLQYPPEWVRKLPHARYVNQHGDAYDDPKPGARVVNAVFNQQIRDLQAAYVAKAFEQIAADVEYVRLGWNYFGELGYPAARFNNKDNCFWAFDHIAQGRAEGRPATIPPRPAASISPALVEWYLDALVDYQSFQIATVRRHTKAKLVLLYGSWGIRPGSIARDLANPKQTELSLGYDFDRLIRAVKDDNVAVCTTWLDADPKFGDDEGPDETRWSPVHFIADRCRKRQPPIDVWGENTGGGGTDAAKISVDRARHFGLKAMIWAFEPQLYKQDPEHTTIKQLETLLK